MTFDEIVSEELSADMDAIKAQIKQLQANAIENEKTVKDKDTAIKTLQDRLAQLAGPKKIEPKIGIGTRKSIQSPPKAPMGQPVKPV